MRVFPDAPADRFRTETIYSAIYAHPRGELRRDLSACLRQGRSKRLPRSQSMDRRGQLPEMLGIHVRPPEVDDRIMHGLWEGDFIKGAGSQPSIGMLVERSSRLLLLVKTEDATAAPALEGVSAKLTLITAPLRQTLTYDQGKEVAKHAELTVRRGVKVYFCDPHSPWQRGICENTNGLLRRCLPKGSDLPLHSQADLDAIADRLNSRPRATHAFHSTFEVFARMLALDHQPSASTY